MQSRSFLDFCIKHRFPAHELLSSPFLTVRTLQLNGIVPPHHFLEAYSAQSERHQFRTALYLAEQISQSSSDYTQTLEEAASSLNNEAWEYALSHSTYYRIDQALKNLDLIEAAMGEAAVSLRKSMSGLDAIFLHSLPNERTVDEYRSATISLMNFASLYSSYLDICRRVVRYSGLKGSTAYRKAITQIISKNSGEHAFVSNLRNFMLHYNLAQPRLEIKLTTTRETYLYLQSLDLLSQGFEWKTEARRFLASRVKIDINVLVQTVLSDVRRLIQFHKRVGPRWNSQEFTLYQACVSARRRWQFKQRVSLGSAIGGKRNQVQSLLSPTVIKMVLESQIADQEAIEILNALANRYKNLTPELVEKVRHEVSILVSRRSV